MKNIIYILAITAQTTVAQINTNRQLDNYKYNEIVFLTTHNAFNSRNDAFSFPNQNQSITRQLTDGVRALMIDVYEENGQLVVYHGNKVLGYKTLYEELIQITDFFENNPNEVVTIIFECYTTASKIENALRAANLYKYVYTIKSEKGWPTIAQMIATDKRLVIFSDKNDASNNQWWYHHLWKYAVETTFEAKDTSDFSSKFQRGKSANPLFIVNHFLTTFIGTGSSSKARAVNSNPYLEQRLSKLISETTKRINFLTVDFYDIGDCIDEVNKMNNISANNIKYSDHFKIQFFPNPVKSLCHILIPDSARRPFQYSINSIEGKSLCISTFIWENTFEINTENLPNGVYTLKVADINLNFSIIKFIKTNY